MRGLIVLILAFTLSCVSKALPPTQEMAMTYALIEDARIGGGDVYAPHMMKEARSLYDEAEREYAAGNHERAEELRQISEIRAKTVISMGRKRLYEDEIQTLQSEIDEANSVKRASENELRENVLRLEQIKDRIAVSQDVMYSKALDSLERAEEKIEAAKGVSAEDFSPQLFSEANQAYKAAQDSLNLGQSEASLKLSEKAISLAERAYDESKKRYDLRSKVVERLSSIYGGQVEPVRGGVKVVFRGLFAPSGTDILFDAYPSLDALASILSEYPHFPISIEAHTNDQRSEEENLRLSKSRAETVRNYLVSKGLQPERFKRVEGLGLDKSLGSGVEDRRIEFIVSLLESDNT
ncbi:MAG TPA: OmpA family protein [Thermodesulfobacteriota bacterium]|nr:OmpA family protein [Thermodesulfobacteriota bacterium]